MGSVEEFAWRRWWLPEGEQPPLDGGGMLEDPEARYGKWLNPVARSIDQLGDIRLLTLLGDPGIGKSHEISLEVDRIRRLGEPVAAVDLASYPTWHELKDDLHDEPAIRRWREDANAELTLFVDAFDEATVAINSLVDGLIRELGRLDHARLRVRIASRAVVWSHRLQQGLERLWPESNAVYVLAPLTWRDVKVAGDAALAGSGAAFVDEVRLRDIGALAARPVTLRLLLSAYSTGGALPDSRLEVYRQGAEELASEHAERRLEDGYGDPPRDARVRAAQLLAAVSLLSGSPQIERRVPEGGTLLGKVSLDQIVTDAVSLGDLDAVWESALIVRSGNRLGTWAHRSIAEFLAASKLCSLPWPTVRHLLADPNDGEGVTPQLAGVAQWLSLIDTQVLAWLVAAEPELLLTADVATRPAGDRETIARSLIEALLRGEAPSGHRSYHHLAYEGFAEDLRPLFDDAQPSWVRREVMKMAADNRLRDFDTLFVELIEEVAASRSPAEYDDLVQLADFATYALTWCDDPDLIERLWAIAEDTEAPTALRVEVLKLVWAKASIGEAIARLDLSAPATRSRRFAQAIADGVEAAITAGDADPATIIAWLSQYPEVVAESDEFQELAALTVLACMARAEDLTDETWSSMGLVLATLIRETNDALGLRRKEDPFPDPGARRRLVKEALLLRNEPADTWGLRTVGLLPDEDFEFWLREYARLRGSGDEEESVAEEVASQLARPDYETREVAYRIAAEESAVSDFITVWFSNERIEQHRGHLRVQEARDARQSRERHDELFSLERALAALKAGDWPVLQRELTRPTAEDRSEKHSYVHGTPVSQRRPWNQLDTSQASAVTTLAYKFLTDPPENVTHGHAEAAAAAHAMLADSDARMLASLPSAILELWLPAVADLPGRSDVASAMVGRIATDDPDWIDCYLVDRLAAEARGEHLFVTARMGTYTSAQVEQALLRHAIDRTTRPSVMESLLTASLEREPDRAAEVAMATARERPDARPVADPGTAPFDLDDPEHAAWRRAVAAAAALSSSDALPVFFDELLLEFERDPDFAEDVIRSGDSVIGRNGTFAALTPEQTASLYLWARLTLPQDRWAPPGVAMHVDPVKEFSGNLLRRLQANPTEEDAEALDLIAIELETAGIPDSAVWVSAAARDAWRSVREAGWAPAKPVDIRDILESPSRRSITSQCQLAQVLLEAIDETATEISRDAGLRTIFWHRQKGADRLYIPSEENEFSDRFCRLLAERLNNVVVRREVQLQPRIGAQSGETPDMEATVVLDDGNEVCCLIEVKGNWHDEVATALTSQLGDRYLLGPRGNTGIYLVAWFAGSAWDPADYRLPKAKRHTTAGLKQSLRDAADTLGNEGIDVRYRVVDLTLEQAHVPAGDDEREADPAEAENSEHDPGDP